MHAICSIIGYLSAGHSERTGKDMNTAGKWFGYLTDEQAKALEANGAQGNNVDGE